MLNIFLPTRLNNNFIIKKKIIIIYITEYSFAADLVQATGKKRTILKSINHRFEESRNIYEAEYLYSLMAKLIGSWEHDYAKIILPSNIVIFRSLTSPFDDIEKIKMIAPFELESFLPFSLSEASIDVIYQSKIRNTTANKVLAAITKEDFLNIYRDSCQKANINLANISVDSIEIIQYILYYSNINDNFFLVMYKNINQLSLYLYQKDTLIGIKNLILEQDSDNNNNNNNTVVERTLLLLLEENKITSQKLNIYTININETLPIVSIIKEKFVDSSVFMITDKTLTIQKELEYQDSSQNNTKDNTAYIIFNYLYDENDIFNLAHKELNLTKTKILFKQIVVSLLLTLLLIIFFLSIYCVNYYRISNSLLKTETDGISYLKKDFSLANKDTANIDTAIKESKKILLSLEKNLPIPVTHKKFLFVNMFAQLVKKLPDSINGLVIDEIRWKLKNQDVTKDSLFLIGQVKDFDSLHLLEESLKKSNLFVDVPAQQDLQFNFHLFIVNEDNA